MKKNKFTLGWFFISLLMVFAVTACDDEDDNVATVTFPEKQTIGGAAGETRSLTFDAVADWTLTSSSTWCYFITEGTPAAKAAEGVKEYSISGKAGKQTVTIGISDEGQDYDNATVASIVINMNGQEAVLAEVTRNAAGRTFKLYKKGEGDEWVEVSAEEGIEAGYDNYIQYKAEANFRFAATNRPEWLTIESGSVVGAANQTVLFGIKVIENRPDFSKYAQVGQLNFQDEEGKSVFTYNVSYKGMDPEAMSYEGPTQWNWEVSLDGLTFTQTSQGVSGGEEKSEYKNFVEFTITAFNDEFMPVFVERYEPYSGYYAFKTSIYDPEYPEETVDWMKLDSYENGKVRVKVQPSQEKREGYVLVFPKALYKKIEANPWTELFEWDMETGTQVIKRIYEENNLLMNVVQKELKQDGDEESGFKITYLDTENQSAEAELTHKPELGSNYGTTDCYQFTQPKTGMIDQSFYIDPMLEGTYDVDWTYEVYQGTNRYENTDEHTIEWDSDKKQIKVWYQNSMSAEADIKFLFKKKMEDGWPGETLKVLLMIPHTNAETQK